MRLVRNAGNDRVLDLIQAHLAPGRRLDLMSGAASLGADAAFLDREEARFRAALARVDDPAPTGWAEAHARHGQTGFRNAAWSRASPAAKW